MYVVWFPAHTHPHNLTPLHPHSQSPVVTELYEMISTEMIREGKLTKKGHIVPNWKGRWFTLRATTLTYREAKDAPILKVCACVCVHVWVCVCTCVLSRSTPPHLNRSE